MVAVESQAFDSEVGKEIGETELDLSVVVPFLNEEETLQPLCERICAAVEPIGLSYEIILVNDGSTDSSGAVAARLAGDDARIRQIEFRRNFGKAAALSAGFRVARGQAIITMDADLQDDPKEIPRFLDKLAEGHDVVSGWKKRRHDPIDKTLPSRVFNKLTARAFGIDIHDINCGFKAYTREAARSLRLYGELHRFTPALLHGDGFAVAEIEVEHHPRRAGASKYGWRRFIKGLLDLMTVMLMTRYQTRPLHFFALLGLPLLLLGSSCVGYLVILWFLDQGPIGPRPLLQIGILLIFSGIQMLGIGLIAELILASRDNDKHPGYKISPPRR